MSRQPSGVPPVPPPPRGPRPDDVLRFGPERAAFVARMRQDMRSLVAWLASRGLSPAEIRATAEAGFRQEQERGEMDETFASTVRLVYDEVLPPVPEEDDP